MAQLEGSEFDFSDLFVSPAIPSGMFGVVPGYDPSASEFFGPNVQRFIEILRGYFEDQDQDDIDRILRQGQIQKFIEVLRRVESGDATIEDLKAVDVSDLAEMPGWSEYYSGVIGEETDASETEDTEEQDPSLVELIEKYGQEAVDDAQRKLEELQNVFGKTIDDPWGTLENIISKTASSPSGSTCGFQSVPGGTGLPEWVRDCVTVGVGIGLPFPLPGPLGSIFKGATVGEIEEAIKSAGYEIGKVLRGETSVEEVVDGLGEWIGDKVRGVLGDEDGDISIESVLGAIGSFLPNVAAGVIWSTFQNTIEEKLNLPILLTTEEGTTEDSRCRDAEGNLTPWGERNPRSCGQPVVIDESDLFGTGGLDSTVECTEGTLDGKGNCVCPDGTLEDADGKCAVSGDSGTDTGTGTTETKCEDPNAQNYGEIGDCGECKAGYSRKPGQTDCTKDNGGGGDDVFDLPCPEGHKRFNGECDLPCPTNPSIAASDPRCGGGGGGDDGGGTTTGTPTFTVVCGQKEPYAPTGNAIEYNAAYREYEAEYNEQCLDSGGGDTGDGGDGGCPAKGTVLSQGCQGTTFVIEFADGECGVIEDSVPNYSFCSGGGDGGGTTVTKCEDPNALNTGQDGPCRYSASDPCLSADYAAANPTECGTAPLDCSDPAYAAANPDECGTTPPPETPSGGGGGGGGGAGGASGMFDLESFEITGDPQLLAKMEFPITDFLSGSMFKDYV